MPDNTKTLDPQAVDVLTNPSNLPLGTLQTAWDALKAARGQTVNWNRLRQPAHLVERTRAPAPTDAVDTVVERCAGRAARLTFLRPNPTGGAA